jgi:hypothetical protein
MASMQALLKIRADVTGENKVQGLATKLGGLSSVAGRVGGGLKGLASAAGGLGGALGALVPAVSVAGLAAMAKGAIDTADNLAKMSAKTGVSVEQLSKFKQAADLGGSSIEEVTGAMLKLNKSLAAGTGPATDALKSLGINATDANGKLKNTNQIMLEVADKFKNMPDGAEKSALAMQLFGKSGANLIPMLNGGSQAIDGLNATMSTKFAKAAEAFNDKITVIQSKLMELGVKLGEALMPAFNAVTDAVGAFVDLIGKLPGPIQGVLLGVVALTAAFVLLAPAISAVISIAGALAGLQLGATIAGWLGAIGPAIIGIKAAFAGLLAWIGGTLLPGLLAFFSGPVGWTILAVAAVVAMAIAFREPLMNFVKWLWEWGKPIREFWIGLWDDAVSNAKKSFGVIGDVFKGVAKTFDEWVIKPIGKAWENLTQLLPKAMENVAKTIKGVFDGIVNGIKSAIRNVLQFVANNINKIGAQVNKLISAFNRLPGPDIPFVPTLSVPAFAKGGVVSGPTLAMVGEAGPEYIVPERKAAAFAMNYLNGARGASAIPAFADGGFVGGYSRPLPRFGGFGSARTLPRFGGNAQINVTTGPVMQQGGQQYVTMADLEKALRKTADGIYASLRTPAGRYAVGVR